MHLLPPTEHMVEQSIINEKKFLDVWIVVIITLITILDACCIVGGVVLDYLV
jgi:hypothetical protein